ncbi:MAG: phage major capsid protein [Anaerolineae bacterium]|jgi:hypothetical protein|nr:phage major capsid protein [Anaerolineae bacterium]
MADPNLGQTVTHAWEAIVKSQPEDNIFEDYWFFNQLKAGSGFKTIDGGRQIQQPIEYATNSTVVSMSEMETISTSRVDLFDTATFEWKMYGGSVVQSELEDAINQGSGAKFDLLAAKLSNLKSTNEKELNEDLYGDGSANAYKVIGGLAALVPSDPTTGTVGGINRANFSFWRSKTAAGTLSSAAYDNLRAAMRSVYNQCSNGVAGDHPTFAVTTRTVFEGFEGLLLANERFTSKGEADGGFKNEVLKFKGCKLAYDDDCTSAALYFLNPKYLKLAVQKGRWMKMFDAVDPANQLIRVFKTATICNLITTNPRMLGIVHTIS